eukprot:scaffold7738_cov107-Isochrysis_galbana.AAC.19
MALSARERHYARRRRVQRIARPAVLGAGRRCLSEPGGLVRLCDGGIGDPIGGRRRAMRKHDPQAGGDGRSVGEESRAPHLSLRCGNCGALAILGHGSNSQRRRNRASLRLAKEGMLPTAESGGLERGAQLLPAHRLPGSRRGCRTASGQRGPRKLRLHLRGSLECIRPAVIGFLVLR